MVNVLDLIFNVGFESMTNISSNVDKWDERYYCFHCKLHVAFRMAYLHVILTYSECQVDRSNGMSPNIFLISYL